MTGKPGFFLSLLLLLVPFLGGVSFGIVNPLFFTFTLLTLLGILLWILVSKTNLSSPGVFGFLLLTFLCSAISFFFTIDTSSTLGELRLIGIQILLCYSVILLGQSRVNLVLGVLIAWFFWWTVGHEIFQIPYPTLLFLYGFPGEPLAEPLWSLLFILTGGVLIPTFLGDCFGKLTTIKLKKDIENENNSSFSFWISRTFYLILLLGFWFSWSVSLGIIGDKTLFFIGITLTFLYLQAFWFRHKRNETLSEKFNIFKSILSLSIVLGIPAWYWGPSWILNKFPDIGPFLFQLPKPQSTPLYLWQAFGQNWPFGTGLGTGEFLLHNQAGAQSVFFGGGFLVSFLELGFNAPLLWVVLLGLVFYGIVKVFKNSFQSLAWPSLLIGSFLLSLFYLDINLLQSPWWWLILGMTIASPKENPLPYLEEEVLEPPKHSLLQNLLLTFGLLVLSLPLLWTGVKSIGAANILPHNFREASWEPDNLAHHKGLIDMAMELDSHESRFLYWKAAAIITDTTAESDTILRFQNSLTYLDQAVKISPYRPEAHYLSSLVKGALGRHESARRSLENAVKYSPQSVKYLEELGRSYSNWDEPLLALRIFGRLADLDPQNPDYRIQIGSIYEKMGNKEKAQMEFRKALALDRTNPKARNKLGY